MKHNCEICGEEALSEEALKWHINEVHIKEGPHCPFCDLAHITISELRIHINSVHSEDGSLTPEASREEQELLSVVSGANDMTSNNGDFSELWTLEEQAERGFLSPLETAKSPVNPHEERVQGEGSSVMSPMSLDSSDVSSIRNSCTSIMTPAMSSTASTSSSPARKMRVTPTASSAESQTSSNGNKKEGDPSLGAVQKKLRQASPPFGARAKSSQKTPRPRNLNVTPTLPSSSAIQCPLCPYQDSDPESLQVHVNRSHFDLSSPMNDATLKTDGASFPCPLCSKCFPATTLLETHVHTDHVDVLRSPKGAESSRLSQRATRGNLNDNNGNRNQRAVMTHCPICDLQGFENTNLLQKHIDSHFASASQETSQDAVIAQELDRRERARIRHERDAFRSQSESGMERAVGRGQMSVAEYHERRNELRASESEGRDCTRSASSGLLPVIEQLVLASREVQQVFLASPSVIHFASDFGDAGWGCGYRNLQMLLSSLISEARYRSRLEQAEVVSKENKSLPSITILQNFIEKAWRQGFDVAGAEQLGGSLKGSRKWIGATEIVAFLSSIGIATKLVDFHKPSANDGTHPKLFEWVREYFQLAATGTFVPPLYLQHQGHSRTIVGIEVLRSGGTRLLIFDPSNRKMSRCLHEPGVAAVEIALLRAIRKTPSAIKCRQFQLVAVTGKNIDT